MMAKLNIQCHFSSLQCHVILQKSFYYAELLLKKHFLLLSNLKRVVQCNVFVETINLFFQVFSLMFYYINAD